MVRAGIKEAHPAGIWCDRSIDGPVIGTLVVVLDRAKNLPNKKKIGKQDPYAVARLAKEAKRTETDVRGGQTPKWDKELRFPVRDSPDYKTLKISVFNDDKKTDLIGETMLDVGKILVSGGGTDDGWRTLKCKEKYAGDILVELTFWDQRPREESEEADRQKRRKEAAILGFEDKSKQTLTKKVGGAREMGSSRDKDRTARGRRPLPSDPTAAREGDRDRNRTSKSRHRHSYHPGSQNSREHHRYNSEPQIIPEQSYRSRRSRHSMAEPHERPVSMAGLPGEPPMEIYEPYDYDHYVPGAGTLGRDDYEDAPPPPSRGRQLQHSFTAPVLHQGTDAYAGQFQPPLHQYGSAPQFDHYDDPVRPLQHRRSFIQQPYDDGMGHALDLQTAVSGVGPDYYDDLPPLSNGPTPMSSTVSSRDGPPPPPPPHRSGIPLTQSPVEMPAELEEPNWDNHNPHTHSRQKSIHDDLALPPAYEDINSRPPSRGPPSPMQIERRRSFADLPATLIPGIDSMVAEDVGNMEKRMTYNGDMMAPVRPLSYHEQPRPRSSRKYHAPQVEEVQDVQLHQPQFPPEESLMDRPMTARSRKDRYAPIVKPMPIHGERDPTVPTVGARHRNSFTDMPARKPAPVVPHERSLDGLPFSPDSYNQINPIPAAVVAASAPKKMYDSNGREIDPSDVLTTDSYAPEPEPRAKSPRPPPVVPDAYRRSRLDRRSASPQPPLRARSPQPPMRAHSPLPYRSHSPQPPRAHSPQPPRSRSPAPPRRSLPAPDYPGPVVKQVSFGSPEQVNPGSRMRSVRAAPSMASMNGRYSMPAGGMVLYDPYSERERERQYDREMAERDARALVPMGSSPSVQNGMEMSLYSRGVPPPPLPAKVPMTREEYALSQEMSMISIGVGDGGGLRSRRGRGY